MRHHHKGPTTIFISISPIIIFIIILVIVTSSTMIIIVLVLVGWLIPETVCVCFFCLLVARALGQTRAKRFTIFNLASPIEAQKSINK